MKTVSGSAVGFCRGKRLPATGLSLAVFAAVLSIGRVVPARAETLAVGEAIRNGNTEEVRAYLEQHRADIDRPVENGLPLISIAVNAGRREIVQLLLDKGAAVDAPDAANGMVFIGGQTALDHAAWHDFDELAALLLSHGASIERKAAPFGPLQYAANRGSLKVAALLLEKGANPDALDRTGDQPPLSLAAFGNHPEMVDLLIAHKANIETTDRSGRTPLGEALLYGRPEISRRLLDLGAKCNYVDHGGGTTLYTAAASTYWPTEEGELDILSRLLSCGVDVNATTPNGETALVAALRTGRVRVAEFLLSKGAGIQGAAGLNGQRPLNLAAAIDGAMRLLTALLAKGADVEAIDRGGNTPFLIAVQHGSLENARFLLAHGAKIDETDALGRTALHLLATGPKAADPRIAEFLLAHGANVNSRTAPPMYAGDGALTPLHAAAASSQTELLGVLLAHGADIDALTTRGDTPLTTAIANDHLDAARLLLERGAKVDGIPGKSQAPLYVSVLKNKPQAATLLLEYRADVNWKQPETGDCALHQAARAGEVEMVQLLLAHRACASCPNRTGMTPLHAAASAGHVEIVAQLLESAADVNARDAAGFTALQRSENPSVQQYLIAHGATGSQAENPQAYEGVCNQVAERASSGRIREILGEDIDGETLKQSPRNDWDEDTLRWADSWSAIKVDGHRFVLGRQDGQIRYLAVIDADNVEEAVCTFTQQAPAGRMVDSKNRRLCDAVMHDTVTYIPYSHLHALSFASVRNDERLAFTSPGEKAARVDLDNDGKLESIVQLEFSSAHGNGCDYSYPAFLNAARTEVDITRTEPILNLGLSCGDELRPFEFEKATYLDWKPQPSAEERDRSVLKLQRGQFETVCRIGTHSTYAAVPIVPGSGR